MPNKLPADQRPDILPATGSESSLLWENTTEYPLAQGLMKLQQWRFEGFQLGYSDLQLDAPLQTAWKPEAETLVLFFNLEGNVSISGSGAPAISFGQLEHSLFFRSGIDGLIQYEGSRCRHFILQLPKATFSRLSKEAPQTLVPFHEAFEKNKAQNFSGGNASLAPVLISALNDLLFPPVDGDLRKLYLTGKSLEIIALQAEAFRRKENEPKRFCKTDYDRERLVFARDYLLQHYDVPPGLRELSLIAGINEFKLKNGFREIFGDTVFGYLSKYKMEMARTMIAGGKLSFAEIAFDLGFSSPQHFSKAFRKHFGYPPSDLKK